MRRFALRHRSLSETALLAAALSALAAIVYGPHVFHGGFIGDAWVSRAWYQLLPHDRFFGAVDNFLHLQSMSTRPLNAVYQVALNGMFGGHASLWAAWQAATSVLMSLCLYLLLRKLDFASLDAALIAALVLIFPAASSLRLWTPVMDASLSISLAALGFLLTLSAFDSRRRRRVLLHGGSLLLFAASLLLYEVALPLMLVSVLLYRLRVSWRQAVPRWLLDCAFLIPIALTVTRSSSSTAQSQNLTGTFAHAVAILEQCPTLLTTVLLPFGAVRWYLLGLLALLPAVALFVAMRLPPADPVRRRLRRWLLVLAGGMAVVILGYSIYAPGIDYYAPLAPGIANRVNAVPGIGWVLVLYALVVLAATLAFRGRLHARSLTSALAVLACCLLGASWLRSVSEDVDAYTQAFREGQRTLAAVRAAVPDPKPHAIIWTFGQPVEVVPGVPVFDSTWSMAASAALMYGDPTLRSFPAFPGTTFACRRAAIEPGGPFYETPVVTRRSVALNPVYGRTYFVETTTGRRALIRTPAQCRRFAAAFPRSPSYPPPR